MTDHEMHSRDSAFGRNAFRICKGRGLEIGALHKPFDLDADVTYLDRESTSDLKRIYAKDRRVTSIRQVQIVWKETTYPFIDDNAYDFVINSHVLEHVSNPGRQIAEWLRIIRPGGTLYMVVPDKRFCFDRRREVTHCDELISKYLSNEKLVPFECYRDFIVNTNGEDGIVRDTSEAFIKRCFDAQTSIHVHTFTEASLKEFFERLAPMVGFEIVHYEGQGLHLHCALSRQ